MSTHLWENVTEIFADIGFIREHPYVADIDNT